MDFSGDKSAGIADYLRMLAKSELSDAGCSIPAIVESFDPATQMIEATPVIRRRRRLDDGSMEVEDRPKQIKIPLCTPYVRMLGFSLTMPVSPGDHVMLVVQDRGIDLWQETGEISDPPEIDNPRAHNYTDAIYVVGPIPLSDPIEDYQIDCTELRNRDRTTAATIWDEEAEVRAKPGNYTTWEAGGSITSFSPSSIYKIATLNISLSAGVNIVETAIVDISKNAGGSISETALVNISENAGGAISSIAGLEISLSAGGVISITSLVEVTVTAPIVNIISPEVNITGNLTVGGAVVAASYSGPAGAAAAMNNGLTAPSAVIDGVEHAAHVHEEFGTYTGPAE